MSKIVGSLVAPRFFNKKKQIFPGLRYPFYGFWASQIIINCLFFFFSDHVACNQCHNVSQRQVFLKHAASLLWVPDYNPTPDQRHDSRRTALSRRVQPH